MLLRTPWFSLAAIIVLALGIGASTAIFTLVEHVLLAPLPYPRSDRLAWIWNTSPRDRSKKLSVFAADIAEMQGRLQSFERIAGQFSGSWNVTGVGEPQRLSGVRVTQDFFETLQVFPMMGRLFRKEEYKTGGENVVIFSHAFWQNHLGSDPNAVGRHIMMDGNSFEVAGVMPADFPFAAQDDMWAPLPVDSPYATGRYWRMVHAFGRLKPGVTLAQAQAELSSAASDLSSRHPEDRGFGFRLTGFLDEEVGDVRQTLWIFTAAVGCVMLIACSNVASLLLARGSARVREMAVRAAVGATRGALVRQLLIESALLAVCGGILGIPLAIWGVQWLVTFTPSTLPRTREIHVDGSVLLFTFLLALVTGLIFGIIPALRGSRPNLRDSLTESGRSGSPGRQGNRLRSTLVVIEIALGVILMASAGVLARTLQHLADVRPGYDTRNVLSMQIALSNVRYRDMAQSLKFFERAIHQLEQIPGVEAVGSTNYLPLVKDKQTTGIWLDSQPLHSAETKIVLDNRVVTPGYFRAMGVPLLAGRFFEWTDGTDAPKVMIVNEAFAREFFTNGDALGKRITMDVGKPWTGEVIGIVGNFRETNFAEAPRREIFTSLTQTTIAGQTMVVRSSGDPAGLLAAVRSALAAVDPDVPIYNVRTMQQQIFDFTAQPRLRGVLIGVFAVVALALSSLGVYGLIACAMAERKREIGIRVALGARPGEVRSMVVSQGLRLTLAGLGLGFLGAAGATRFLQQFLFGVSATDPLTYGVTAVIFLAVALAASYLPARRATRIDPIEALRSE